MSDLIWCACMFVSCLVGSILEWRWPILGLHERRKSARIREALEWYAQHCQPPCDCCDVEAAVIQDGGERAQIALGYRE